MADDDTIRREMAASYSVAVTGIERTKREVARLDGAIKSLRLATYATTSSGTPTSMTVASQLGGKDILVTKIDDLEGRVQSKAEKIMASEMAHGRRLQAQALNEAETPYGKKRFARGQGKSAGRNDTGHMINSIKTNVETIKTADTTIITGWHGWSADDRDRYFELQEKGGRMAPANSLGIAIFTVREQLKRDLGELR